MSNSNHNDAGRLRWMGLFGAFLLAVTPWVTRARTFDHDHAEFDAILKAHVVNGLVDYRALKSDPGPLIRYLARLAIVPEKQFRGWTEPQRLAFLVNLYNASTLRLILEHYPLESIKDIGGWLKGPWDQPVVHLFGKVLTLNTLEHGILRKEYHEPRLHMALVCAAKGCPPLRSEAYTADHLNEQLDDQCRTYLAGPTGMRIDRRKGEVRISSIFKWYGKDFPSVAAFVSKYSERNIAELKIRYLDYDWSLNELK